jgi:hypothetical protein
MKRKDKGNLIRCGRVGMEKLGEGWGGIVGEKVGDSYRM